MTKRHSLILLIFPLLLAGCTDADWDHVLSYSGLEENAAQADAPRPAAPTVAATAAPSQPSAAVAAEPVAQSSSADFCRSVATQDASADGFDAATQARIFAQSYAQCAAIYTR
jgi:hypothetical protein